MCANCDRLRVRLDEVTAERDAWRSFAEGDADEEARVRSPMDFTRQQWRLLTQLVRAEGRPLTGARLSTAIRIGPEGEGADDHLCAPVVCKLRAKLAAAHWPRYPLNTRSAGYYIPREDIPGLAAWLGIETRLNARHRSAA